MTELKRPTAGVGLASPWRRRGRGAKGALAATAAAFTLAAVVGLATAVPATAAALFSWSPTGALHTARFDATATTLANGEVLVAGGATGSLAAPSATGSAEIYNPTTGAFSVTGSLGTSRFDASAALLSNGDVLVTGGATGTGNAATATDTVELYVPSLGGFTAAHNLPVAVFGATATALSTGEVLVAGGDSGTLGAPVPSATTELYDPATNSWSSSGTLAAARAFASAKRLANGNVLVAGGSGTSGSLGSAELFTTDTHSWSSAGSMPFASSGPDEALMSNGDVLVAGGAASSGAALPNAAIYTPTKNTWSATGSLSAARAGANAVTLPNGDVLVAGGTGTSNTSLSSAERYSSSTGRWTTTGSLGTARSHSVAALVSSGMVLVAGGAGTGGAPTASAESYFAGIPPAFTSPSALSLAMGASANFVIAATGNPTPTITLAGALPTGLSFTGGSGVARITGRAAGPAGSFNVTLLATNGVAAETESFTVAVGEPAAPGYLVASASGTVFAYGLATDYSSLFVNPRLRPIVAIARSTGDRGYYLVTKLGNVYNFGGARFYGSAARLHVASPVASFATTPDGKGYWLALTDGTVYRFGDAAVYSSLSLNTRIRPIVAIVSSPDGKGYWLVTDLGNVYAYGDAPWLGSLAHAGLPARVTSFARTTDGKGYWIGLANGVVFHFGDAAAFARFHLNPQVRPLVAIKPTLDGDGYYLITSQGNIYGRGDALWHGSPARVHLTTPIVSAAIPD